MRNTASCCGQPIGGSHECAAASFVVGGIGRNGCDLRLGPKGGAPTANGQQAVASIPEFSGVWVHPSWPSVDPPLSGPGRYGTGLRSGESNGNQLVGDYTNPILKPHAAAVVKEYGRISLAGV